MTFSTPSPSVLSIAIAPTFSASARRSFWVSTTITWLAPLVTAESAAISPTGPAP